MRQTQLSERTRTSFRPHTMQTVLKIASCWSWWNYKTRIQSFELVIYGHRSLWIECFQGGERLLGHFVCISFCHLKHLFQHCWKPLLLTLFFLFSLSLFSVFSSLSLAASITIPRFLARIKQVYFPLSPIL